MRLKQALFSCAFLCILLFGCKRVRELNGFRIIDPGSRKDETYLVVNDNYTIVGPQIIKWGRSENWLVVQKVVYVRENREDWVFDRFPYTDLAGFVLIDTTTEAGETRYCSNFDELTSVTNQLGISLSEIKFRSIPGFWNPFE